MHFERTNPALAGAAPPVASGAAAVCESRDGAQRPSLLTPLPIRVRIKRSAVSGQRHDVRPAPGRGAHTGFPVRVSAQA